MDMIKIWLCNESSSILAYFSLIKPIWQVQLTISLHLISVAQYPPGQWIQIALARIHLCVHSLTSHKKIKLYDCQRGDTRFNLLMLEDGCSTQTCTRLWNEVHKTNTKTLISAGIGMYTMTYALKLQYDSVKSCCALKKLASQNGIRLRQ
jgi:hypothetical protein